MPFWIDPSCVGCRVCAPSVLRVRSPVRRSSFTSLTRCFLSTAGSVPACVPRTRAFLTFAPPKIKPPAAALYPEHCSSRGGVREPTGVDSAVELHRLCVDRRALGILGSNGGHGARPRYQEISRLQRKSRSRPFQRRRTDARCSRLLLEEYALQREHSRAEEGGKAAPILRSSRMDCDVHKWMGAWIIVVDHPYYAITDENGASKIDEIPPGKYVLRAWHETLGKVDKDVTLAGGQTVAVDFQMSKAR